MAVPVRLLPCLLAAAALALPPRPGALAQGATASLGGSLLTRGTRVPVEGARLTIVGTGLVTSSDSAGRFVFASVPAGVRVLQARAVGYAVGTWIIQLEDGQAFRQAIELEARAVEVEGVTVEGRASESWRSEAGFDRRRDAGRGFFITREDIAGRRAATLADLLRTVPGVLTTCRGLGGCMITVGRTQGRNCLPEYFLDGFPATFATGPNFPIVQIRGVEIYREPSEVPVEFQRPGLRCGVIAIWTVEPGARLGAH